MISPFNERLMPHAERLLNTFLAKAFAGDPLNRARLRSWTLNGIKRPYFNRWAQSLPPEEAAKLFAILHE